MRNWIFKGIGSFVLAAVLAGCAAKEMVIDDTAPVTDNMAQAEAQPAPAPAEEKAAAEPSQETAPPPAAEAAPAPPAAKAETPPPAPAPVLKGADAEKYRDIDPALLIYLSGRGVLAGTGDPNKVAGDAEKAGAKDHPAALELSGLPKDRYGLIDWGAAIKNGNVKPLDSLDPKAPAMPPFNLDIVIKSKSNFMPDVVFPHYTHTLWLTCTNCHTKIFQMKAGGNPEMTMPKIAAGDYCGRCHNRVAFPLSDCTRCHVKPKEAATATQK
jgi:c(7)-type cytochrome triheme protein